MQVLMGIGYNLSLRMSFMICRIKKRLKKIEDIMKKVMFINKTIAITNKGYSGEKQSCQNTLEQTVSAARPIKY